MAQEKSNTKDTLTCMERAKLDFERIKKNMGPTNRELLKEITELKQMVADLKILVLTKPH